MPDAELPSAPFDTERQALDHPAVKAIHAAFDAAPGAGKMRPHNEAMLTAACEAAGVEIGAYDRSVLAGLSSREPQVCAVIAGIITRAAEKRESR